jgi:1,4-dihydroxy-2-naphthoyl-CoA synthase
VKNLIVAATIAAFGAAVILPAVGSFDSAYAATKKKKKTAKKPATKQPAPKSM